MRALRIVTCLLFTLALAACSGNGNGEDQDAGPDGDAGVDAGGDTVITCATIADCPAVHLCLGGLCVQGIECHAQEECPAEYICNFMSNVCVPEDQCTSDAECTEASAPFCMVSSGMCVECHQESHCTSKLETPYCSNDSWTCVVCTQDAHCPQEQSCIDDVCMDPSSCESDDDCLDSAKPYCNTVNGQCYACLTDDHCGVLACEPMSHQCVECYLDDHCTGTRKKCYLGTFTCVGCLDDEDCLPGQHCHTVQHECTDTFCEADSDCNEPSFSFCNTATGDCVQCVEHDHCGPYMWCREFICDGDCQTDAECVEKYGPNQHCDTNTGNCFEAECMTDADCVGNPDGEHCKTAASPSNPPQYTCVECTLDDHCDEFFECSPTAFTCRVMPCYRYDNPDETCHEIAACYFCDFGSGMCEPAYDCTYPDGLECCRGYTCNTFEHCERNTHCPSGSDLECPEGSTCNTNTLECEVVPCCSPPCAADEYCTGDCVCMSTCIDQGGMCDFMRDNCCPGLHCPFMPPFCVP